MEMEVEAGPTVPDVREREAVRSILARIAAGGASGGPAGSGAGSGTGLLVRDLVERFSSGLRPSSPALAPPPGGAPRARRPPPPSPPLPLPPPPPLPRSWEDSARTLAVLREALTLSAEAREVLRFWCAQVPSGAGSGPGSGAGPVRFPAPPPSLTDPARVRSRVLGLGPSPLAAAAGAAPPPGTGCWDRRSASIMCGRFREAVAAGLLGRYSLAGSSAAAAAAAAAASGEGRAGARALEKEAGRAFAAMMADAPRPAGGGGDGGLGVWEVWFRSLLPVPADGGGEGEDEDEDGDGPAVWNLAAVLALRSPSIRDLPRRRRSRSRAASFATDPPTAAAAMKVRDRKDGDGGSFVMEVKLRALRALVRLIACSGEEVWWVGGDAKGTPSSPTLARCVLVATLDEIEGSLIPSLVENDGGGHAAAELGLEFCAHFVALATNLCHTERGFNLLRTQMVADRKKRPKRRAELAPSGIAVMVDLLDSVVLRALRRRGASLPPSWHRLLKEIASFFHMVLQHVQHLRSRFEAEAKSGNTDVKYVTLLSLVTERRVMFISCWNLIAESGDGIEAKLDPDVKTIADVILSEISYDLEDDEVMRG